MVSYFSLNHLHQQDFDIEVEGTRELKLHVYSKSRLNFDEHCAQGKIEVSRVHVCFLRACVRACVHACVFFARYRYKSKHFVDYYDNHIFILF